MKSLVVIGAFIRSLGVNGDSCSTYAACLSPPFIQGVPCAAGGTVWRPKWWTQALPSLTSLDWEVVGACEEAPIGECAAPDWDANTIYPQPKMEVVFEYKLWQNKWWSPAGAYPGYEAGNWGAIRYCSNVGGVTPTRSPLAPTIGVVNPIATLPPSGVITPIATLPPSGVITPIATLPPSGVITPIATLPPSGVITPIATLPPSGVVTPVATLPSAGVVTPVATLPTSAATSPSTSSSTTNANSGEQVVPTGPVGANGECVWPEWQAKTYRAGDYVGWNGSEVYVAGSWADKGVSPSSGAPWTKAATCTGTAPKSHYTLEEMKAMLVNGGAGLQVVYDPWTPLLPTDAMMAATEAGYRESDIAKKIVEVNKVRPIAEVEAVQPGRAANPENVLRVEKILPGTLFDKFFPVRHKKYTYENFLKSVALFPAYCGTYTDGRDSEAICKKVLATSFAHYVQETGANHGSLFYKADSHLAYPDNINDGADVWYQKGTQLGINQQALFFLREIGYTEGAGGDAYRQCTGTPGNWFFELTYPCGKGVSYFGRGSKQLSWNYNYGPFSQQVYGDATVLLNDPSAVADSWLNFASGLWFSVTPQSPKPPMLWVIDGTWVPNAADKAANRTPGFGATINIINGGLECNGASHPGPARRAAAYQYFMSEFQQSIPADEDLLCSTMKPFDQSSSASTKAYYTMDWSGPAQCSITESQTPWQVSRDGDYAKCVGYFFRSHWFQDGSLISDFGLAPGQTYA